MSIRFEKMHGLGNDFVIIDERKSPMQLVEKAKRTEIVRALSDRKHGVGCDQLIVMRPSARADVYMQIYNADGGEVSACGNATRCVGWLMMRDGRKDAALIETAAGMLECRLAGKELVKANMGHPRLGWQEIPLSREEDTLHVKLERGPLSDPVAVNMGNPHVVFFTKNAARVHLHEYGPALECDELFPERANISVAEVRDPGLIALRTWERGVGKTLACGTAACAAAVAARRRGLTEPEMRVLMGGGELTIEWAGTQADPAHDVWMTGPVSHVFSGELKEGMWV